MRCMYLEDLAEGQVFMSSCRTITETDVVNFCGLSGDYNPIHADAEFASQTAYGQRVVHGILGLAVMTGLLDRMGTFDGTAIAMLGLEEWRFVQPVFIGDTLQLRLTIDGVRRTKSGDRGVVLRTLELLNQRDEVVQTGRINLLVRSRDRAAST